MEYESKKPKCKPCEMHDRITKANDGDVIPVPEKCAHCDYHLCNYADKQKGRKMELLKAILAGISAGLKCLFWPDYSKRKF